MFGGDCKFVCDIVIKITPLTIRLRLALIDKRMLAAAAEVGGVEEVREEHKVCGVDSGAARKKNIYSQVAMLYAR